MCNIIIIIAPLCNFSQESEIELLQEITEDKKKPNATSKDFVVYPERWWILITVLFIGFSAYSHWAAYPAVEQKVSEFYKWTNSDIDTIIMMRFFLGIPCFFLNLLIAEKFELRTIILSASTFNAMGKKSVVKF